MSNAFRKRSLGRTYGAVVLVLVMCVLTACAQIPTESAVSSRDVSVQDPAPIFLQADGPQRDATPQEIVDGFVSAQAAGIADSWAVAKEFLTSTAAAKWDPASSTSIYTGELVLQTLDNLQEDSAENLDLAEALSVSVQGTAKSVGIVATNGSYSESVPDAKYDLTFDLVKNSDGQWRISSLQDGVLISKPNFQTQYRAASVYFLSPQGDYLVPEVRWVALAKLETYVVNALLGGPSPWLQDAVVTAIPEGTRLMYDSVPSESGTAVVNLSSEVQKATPRDRELLATQIQETLTKLPGIRDVRFQVNSVDIQVVPDANVVRDPILANDPVVLSNDELFQVKGRTLVALDARGSLAPYSVSALATEDRSAQGVFLDGADTIRRIPDADGEAAVLFKGRTLIPPSLDRFGWAWTGEKVQPDDRDGKLSAVSSDATAVPVKVPWLTGRLVRAARVSHDGARVVVLSSSNGVTRIDVAGVLRDENGVPQSLSDPISVGAQVQDAELVQWLDESTLGVIGKTSGSDIEIFASVPLSGSSEAVATAEDVNALAIGRGLRSVFIGTADNTVLGRGSIGSAWVEIADDARLPTFPG
ncbi:LpqB family beta-propeller domain-containing protein [Timonella sp. A28]|uniref:LpqB family beta-propeller domain-containing protein n=1 Tax=Timonella sp. A28 TaxID=3442640 RepID=UPI003EBD3389